MTVAVPVAHSCRSCGAELARVSTTGLEMSDRVTRREARLDVNDAPPGHLRMHVTCACGAERELDLPVTVLQAMTTPEQVAEQGQQIRRLFED